MGIFSLVACLFGIIGSCRIACCLNWYMFLGGALTLGGCCAAGCWVAAMCRPRTLLLMGCLLVSNRGALHLPQPAQPACPPHSTPLRTAPATSHKPTRQPAPAPPAAELGLVLSMFFNYGGTVDNMVAYGKKNDPTWDADE